MKFIFAILVCHLEQYLSSKTKHKSKATKNGESMHRKFSEYATDMESAPAFQLIQLTSAMNGKLEPYELDFRRLRTAT